MRNEKTELKGWTSGLVALGLAGLASAQADESPHPVLTTLASTTLSGYVDTSAIVNFGPGNVVVGRSFDGTTKQDGFNLDVVKLQLEKPIEDGKLSAGYNIGLLMGPDANAFASASQGLPFATSDFAVKNAYVALRVPVGNGLDFKIGTWNTPMGYEVLEAGANPNFSRSFGFYLEPTVHTGILASYALADWLSLAGGAADPNDVIKGPNTINYRSPVSSLFTYMGSFTLTAPESLGFLKGATLTGSIMDHGVPDGPDVVQYYVGATVPTPLKALSVGVAYDYRGWDRGQGVDSNYANAVAGYLLVKATDRLKFAGRVEYATGTAGTWYATGGTGNNNELLGVTATIDYSIWANVITRLEFRWDHDLSGTGVFNTGDAENATSLALNVIYNF
jgi:hypothetical protein